LLLERSRIRSTARCEGQQLRWGELNMRRFYRLVLATGWLTIAHAGDRAAELMREQGLLEYENGHYAAAAIHFQNAAESGDARSAEVLALMYRFGARLYGEQVHADAAKSAHWAAVAADRRFVAATNPTSASR